MRSPGITRRGGGDVGLFKRLDLWSINDGLQKIIDYYYDGNERNSQYWDYYSDQINEMGELAADMINEMRDIRRMLELQMPWKEKNLFYEDDECTYTEVAWWNTAACMLSDTDMVELLEGENIYGSDIWEEKKKRIKALDRLTKKQQMLLYTEVIGFIFRYQELMAAFETITAIIRELDYNQSMVSAKDGSVKLPDAAYL